MYKNIKNITLALCLSFMSVSASTSDYKSMYAQEHKAFKANMQSEIKKLLPSASKEVQELYSQIDYMPIWVDKDYLTHYSELLISELKEDFEKGLYPELKESYNKLLPNEDQIFTSDSLTDKVAMELNIMQLYVTHIKDILKDKHSKHTPLSLLQNALKEESLIYALNAITNYRIEDRMLMVEHNSTLVKQNKQIARDKIRLLNSKDSKKRLKAMYDMIYFKPVWVTKEGLTSFTEELFEQIENDITFSKNSNAYKNYLALKSTKVSNDKGDVVELELQIMKLYQSYMSHLLYGSIDWKKFQNKLRHTKNADWVVHNVLHSSESLLIEAIAHQSLAYAFNEATPSFPMYAKLVDGLKKYQAIVSAGGWDVLPDFKDLKPKRHAKIVPALRDRLKIEGDYKLCTDSKEDELYDDCLLKAVKKFQLRHGLEPKGYIGKLTRKALSETAEHKVERIKLNLDRMKWVKRSKDKFQIWVNIPAYKMYVYDNEKLIDEMKVIVGRKGHHTPIFYNRIRTIVLNPYWRIPASIIRHDMIPKLQENSDYTNSKNIEIHKGYSEHSPIVNPHNVNWEKYGKKLPPYKFMQSPGVTNALGKIKYLFPNKYSVYMHDTNQPYLFSKDLRALSHGCVRLHKPVDLLELFSKRDHKIDFKKSQHTLKENKKTSLRLSKSIPIDIIYLTTWIGSDGSVNFRDDIYGYDEIQTNTKKGTK